MNTGERIIDLLKDEHEVVVLYVGICRLYFSDDGLWIAQGGKNRKARDRELYKGKDLNDAIDSILSVTH